MVKLAVVGLGKMGISHLAILRAHPKVDVVAACDSASYVTDTLTKFAGMKCYDDFDRMLASESLDAVLIATPSRLHARMVRTALENGLHVFCEKPFVLDREEGEALVALAEQQGAVTQVGYHYRFAGTFQEAAKIIASGALGDVHHVRVEAYGPVVLRRKSSTWRSVKNEGGGALYDYACHAVDLVNFVVGPPDSVGGVVRHGVFSRDVDDEIYCSLYYENGASGQLCVNWSDESYRKMSAKVSVWGTNGRLSADRQECQIYLRTSHPAVPEMRAGWTIRYTTDLTDGVWYYLRGEEYSAQIEYFVESIELGRRDGLNNLGSALEVDGVVAMIEEAGSPHDGYRAPPTARGGVFGRFFS